jgi:hypothetical protein
VFKGIVLAQEEPSGSSVTASISWKRWILARGLPPGSPEAKGSALAPILLAKLEGVKAGVGAVPQ